MNKLKTERKKTILNIYSIYNKIRGNQNKTKQKYSHLFEFF
jgi:hypothetical protein